MILSIRGYSIFLSIALFISIGTFTTVIGSSPIQSNVLLKIVDLNNDTICDTIIGDKLSGKVLMPHKIIWGTALDSLHIEPLANKELLFIYPEFRKFNGFYSLSNFNKNDTIIDICFYLNGEIEIDTNSSVSINKMIVLVGQKGLDTLNSIAVDSIYKFQTTPFIAYQLRTNYELKKLNKVDKHKQAFSIKRVYLDIQNPTIDSLEGYIPPRIVRVEESDPKTSIRVFPNPTSFKLFVECLSDNISCNISLIDITGRLLYQVEHCFAKGMLEEVDVSNIPVGTYQLILSNAKTSQSFNIVIIR